MKLLLVGNHTCGNRGDGAILRGLLSYLREFEPGVEIDTLTRYPVSSSCLLGETLYQDTLYEYHHESAGRFGYFKNKLVIRVLAHMLHFCLKSKLQGCLPAHVKQQVNTLKSYDAVIQVGGSFFVDLYGVAQFEHALCALLADKPLYMLGHSVGPFQRKGFNAIASSVFERAKVVSLRESVSLDLMKEAQMPVQNTHQGADTAWLVEPIKVEIPSKIQRFVEIKPTIAITVRRLEPFDKRLGVTQDEYEQAFAQLANTLIGSGYNVLACSTCTAIGGYHKDDRMVALRIANNVENKGAFLTVLDELNDIELGTVLSNCVLTIGTRLHSAIISMNFGTPAISFNYEHKSAGIMQQLGLPACAQDIKSLFDGSLFGIVQDILAVENMSLIIAKAVQAEKQKAQKMVQMTLSDIKDSQ